MKDDLEISIATSSGSRHCFVCGSRIYDRTIMMRGRKIQDEIVLHVKCFEELTVLTQEFSNNLGVGE